jgi:hypothetical protein
MFLLVGKGKDCIPIPTGETYPAYNHTISCELTGIIFRLLFIDNYYWAKQIRDIPQTGNMLADWIYQSGEYRQKV